MVCGGWVDTAWELTSLRKTNSTPEWAVCAPTTLHCQPGGSLIASVVASSGSSPRRPDTDNLRLSVLQASGGIAARFAPAASQEWKRGVGAPSMKRCRLGSWELSVSQPMLWTSRGGRAALPSFPAGASEASAPSEVSLRLLIAADARSTSSLGLAPSCGVPEAGAQMAGPAALLPHPPGAPVGF